MCKQGDHLSVKHGNVRNFDICQGNVMKMTKRWGSVRRNIVLFVVDFTFWTTPVHSSIVAAAAAAAA